MPFFDYHNSRSTPPWIRYISAGSLNLPSDITEIPDFAFRDAWELTKAVKIKPNIKKIGDWAFYNCLNIESVTLPNTVESIGRRAFAHCTSLQSIKLPKGLKEIPDFAFEDCFRLKSIEIPESVTKIGLAAFESCYKLESVTIKNPNVEFAGKRTFWMYPVKVAYVSPEQKLTKEFRSQFPSDTKFIPLEQNLTSGVPTPHRDDGGRDGK